MHDGGQVFVDRYCNQLIPCKKRKSKGRFAGNRKYASAPAPRQVSPAGRGPAGKPAPRAPVPDSQHPQPVEGAVVLVRPRALVALQVLDVLDHLDRGIGRDAQSQTLQGVAIQVKEPDRRPSAKQGCGGNTPKAGAPLFRPRPQHGDVPGPGLQPEPRPWPELPHRQGQVLGPSRPRRGVAVTRQELEQEWVQRALEAGRPALVADASCAPRSSAPEAETRENQRGAQSSGSPAPRPGSQRRVPPDLLGVGGSCLRLSPPTQPTRTALQVSRT